VVQQQSTNPDNVNYKTDRKSTSNGVPPGTELNEEMYTESKGDSYFRTPRDLPNFNQTTKDDTIKVLDSTDYYKEEPMIYEVLDGDADGPASYLTPVSSLKNLESQTQFYEIPSQYIAPAVEADDDSEQPQLYLDVISIDNEMEIYSDIPDTVEQARNLQDDQESND